MYSSTVIKYSPGYLGRGNLARLNLILVECAAGRLEASPIKGFVLTAASIACQLASLLNRNLN